MLDFTKPLGFHQTAMRIGDQAQTQQSYQSPDATKLAIKLATGRVSSQMYAQPLTAVDTKRDRVDAEVINNYLEEHPEPPYRVSDVQSMRISTIAGHQSSHTEADIGALQTTLSISPHPSVTTARSLIYTDITLSIDGTTKTIPGYLMPHSYITLAGRDVTINRSHTTLHKNRSATHLCFHNT